MLNSKPDSPIAIAGNARATSLTRASKLHFPLQMLTFSACSLSLPAGHQARVLADVVQAVADHHEVHE